MAYDGKMGIDLLASPVLAFMKMLVPEKTDLVSLSGNVIKISLGDIDKLAKVFEQLALKSIVFDPSGIVIKATFF